MRSRLLCAATASALLFGCGGADKAQHTATPVRTAVVETIESAAPLRYSANIVPYAQVELAFKSAGLVQSIRQVKGADGRMRSVQQGDWVEKGTVLATVRPDEYRERVKQAEGALARAQANYEHATLDWQRASTLFAQQAMTKPDFDTAKAQFDGAAAAVDEARAQLQQAQIALRDCSIVAPFGAWVLSRSAELGLVANPTMPAFTVADTRMVKAVFGVPDLMVSRVRLGGKQAIAINAASGTFDGRVTAISPAADPNSRVYSVEVTLPNLKNQLRAGMIASLEFAEEAPSVTQPAVELEAVVRHPDVPNAFAVYVADASATPAVARVRTIEPGDAHGNKIVILKGLKPGERVITTGATLVKDGEPVNIIP